MKTIDLKSLEKGTKHGGRTIPYEGTYPRAEADVAVKKLNLSRLEARHFQPKKTIPFG